MRRATGVRAKAADTVVFILGDSTMQGYQLADGDTRAHQLTQALTEQGKRP